MANGRLQLIDLQTRSGENLGWFSRDSNMCPCGTFDCKGNFLFTDGDELVKINFFYRGRKKSGARDRCDDFDFVECVEDPEEEARRHNFVENVLAPDFAGLILGPDPIGNRMDVNIFDAENLPPPAQISLPLTKGLFVDSGYW